MKPRDDPLTARKHLRTHRQESAPHHHALVASQSNQSLNDESESFDPPEEKDSNQRHEAELRPTHQYLRHLDGLKAPETITLVHCGPVLMPQRLTAVSTEPSELATIVPLNDTWMGNSINNAILPMNFITTIDSCSFVPSVHAMSSSMPS